MRLPVERRRAPSIRGPGVIDAGRSLPPVAERMVVAQKLGKVDEAGTVGRLDRSNTTIVVPAKAGTHNPRRKPVRPGSALAITRLSGTTRELRQRAHRRLLMPELAFAEQNVKAGADDHGCTHNSPRRRQVAEYDEPECRGPHD